MGWEEGKEERQRNESGFGFDGQSLFLILHDINIYIHTQHYIVEITDHFSSFSFSFFFFCFTFLTFFFLKILIFSLRLRLRLSEYLGAFLFSLFLYNYYFFKKIVSICYLYILASN